MLFTQREDHLDTTGGVALSPGAPSEVRVSRKPRGLQSSSQGSSAGFVLADLEVNLLHGWQHALGLEKDCFHTSFALLDAEEELRERGECCAGKASLSLLSSVSSVTQSCLTLCDPHGLQHARLPCPLPIPGVYSNSCPLSQ